MLTFIVFFAILSILVLIHELGHFLVAKRSGIFVEEFGFGLPPRIFGIRVGETLYSINLLPFGGFVRLYGENGEEDMEFKGKKVPRSRSFILKSPLVRIAVVVAGVVMNFVLACVAFAIAYSITGIPTETDTLRIVEVALGSPAEQAGLAEGDVITKLTLYKDAELRADKIAVLEPVDDVEEFLTFVDEAKGQPVEVEVTVVAGDKGQLVKERLVVTPRLDPPVGEGAMGVAISMIEQKFYPAWEMPIRGIGAGFQEALGWARLIATMLGEMFWRLVSTGQVQEGVAGPVGIYRLTGEVVQFGFVAVLRFLGILSINLAVVNILPLPALDGGRLWFIVYEGVTGHKIDRHLERMVHTGGMVALLGLLVLITFNDLVDAFGWTGWLSQLKGLFVN
jgi:regulator of sigma E protease